VPLAIRRACTCFAAFAALCGCRPVPQAAPPAPPPAVSVARPASYPVQTYYEYNGYLDAVESVQIRARVEGFLTEARFTEGVEVQQGELLFTIDPREFQAGVKRAEADRLKAAAELKKARSDEVRARQTLNSRAISEEDYQQRVAARETAEAVLKQTEAAVEAAQLKLSFAEIRAPIAGRISRTLVTRGNLVGQGEATLLTTIVSTDPLYVYFDAPERDLVESLRIFQARPMPTAASGEIPVEIGVATEEGYPHRGRIDFQENRVDTGTGTVRVRGRIPNPKVSPGDTRLLYPGLYARVRVPVGGPEPRLVLPEDALMTGQEGRFVYVVGKDGTVQKRTVEIGQQVWAAPRAGANGGTVWVLAAPQGAVNPGNAPRVRSVIAILSGLTADDRVVVSGLQRARPGAPVTPEEWELRAPPIPTATAAAH
jgi:multidrug efflux system membrane fusion protein